MAYEDLTPQERQVLQQSLLAPPPATFAAPGQFNIDPKLRMEAQLGLLGPEGRFIEQLARQQDEERRKEQENAMAQRILSVLGTPDAMNVMRKEAEQNPNIFNSGTVQQAMQFGQMAKQEQERADEEAARARGKEMASMFLNAPNKGLSSLLAKAAEQDFQAYATPEAQSAVRLKQQQAQEQFAKRGQKKERKQERAEAKVKSAIANATPDQLDQFAERFPQFLPEIEKKSSDLATIEETAAQLPPSLRTPENLSRGYKAKAALNKFNKSLPAQLQKLSSYEQRKAAAEAADAYTQQAKAFETALKRDEDAEPPPELDNLRRLATVELGLDPDSVTLSDEFLGKIGKTRVLFEEVATESFLPDPVRQARGIQGATSASKTKGIQGPMGIVVE
jgi:hypothetical protein